MLLDTSESQDGPEELIEPLKGEILSLSYSCRMMESRGSMDQRVCIYYQLPLEMNIPYLTLNTPTRMCGLQYYSGDSF